MIQEFKSKRKFIPFKVKRTQLGIEINDLFMQGPDTVPTFNVTAFDFVKYITRAKTPLIFGKKEFNKNLTYIKNICTSLKGETKIYTRGDYRPELILISGPDKDLDVVYDFLKNKMTK